jgi:heme-degrading monooxygenase HmoA
VIFRLWHTRVKDGAERDYERFAREQSLPMFEAQDGCDGVVFLRGERDCVTLSIWDDEEAVRRLEAGERYQQTVRRIEASGLLVEGTQRVEVYEAFGGFLNSRVRDALGTGASI